MSQISEYLKYQIQLRETMLPQCSEKKNNKKQKKQTKSPYHYKIPKKTQDSAYKLYILPSEFPLFAFNHSGNATKFKSLFQTLGKNDYFL
ncbi:unnamed protein product [Paramecium pentaurelia]|uniref:Uncharacterized protein n=1 Tax=Paramecium pentaurelia TaxID=43138 RepID=A0A8S1V6M4_9CILI|nr:unnamed protein product [Paramecium pentaurelia]